ncbi:2TM domain-containing protein [Actinoplanes sp. TBRC 11911]|uniref:2TM domain-containing protein n=1 Tax=Actinoplanes sp. TBRC 11911 TaxID=2729386 RepID=UPI00145C5852|nr:2TM domain-containing protein [Actinoplanes sp. TBRC 11911]NMO57828.1 2TM domain-containing protein [Actinoplanes sp. TBRC 11911]
MTVPETTDKRTTNDLREAAITHLRKKRELQVHLLAFVLVNLALNLIWWLTTPGGFYWPMFPLLGWGIGIVFHTWDVLVGSVPTENQVGAEMDRMYRRRTRDLRP